MPRRLNRSLDRPVLRTLTTGRRHLDFLAQALVAYGRSLRASRRLMKLAPQFFDSAVVHRADQERLERAARRKQWEPALQKIYGGIDPLPPDERDFPALPKSPRIIREIETALEQRARWLQIGSTALADFQNLQPHACPTFSQIARLLEISFAFKRLACGLETTRPNHESQPPTGYTVEDALLKIYGDPLPDEPPEITIR